MELLLGATSLSVMPDRGKINSSSYRCDRIPGWPAILFSATLSTMAKGNDNTNGLLREYFLKGKEITEILEDYIQTKVAMINLCPRKCLNYRTQCEPYFEKVLYLA